MNRKNIGLEKKNMPFSNKGSMFTERSSDSVADLSGMVLTFSRDSLRGSKRKQKERQF